jgi:hypothetical protein
MAHDLTRNPLEPSLNPPHDTRHDTRLPVLTEVDGSMAPLEELDDSTKGLEGWHGAGLLWNCSIPITNTKGLYLYPCPNTTPSRPRVQHLLPKLMPRCRYPSCTCHQFIPSLYSGHVITYSRMFPFPSTKQPFCRMMACYRPHAPLPNALRKISCRMVFLYQTRPTSQSLSCINFWC